MARRKRGAPEQAVLPSVEWDAVLSSYVPEWSAERGDFGVTHRLMIVEREPPVVEWVTTPRQVADLVAGWVVHRPLYRYRALLWEIEAHRANGCDAVTLDRARLDALVDALHDAIEYQDAILPRDSWMIAALNRNWKEIQRLRTFRNRFLGWPDKRPGRGRKYSPQVILRDWEMRLANGDDRLVALKQVAKAFQFASVEACRKYLEREGVKGCCSSVILSA